MISQRFHLKREALGGDLVKSATKTLASCSSVSIPLVTIIISRLTNFEIDKYICFDLPLFGFLIAGDSNIMCVFVDPLNPWISSTIFLKVLLESYVNDQFSPNTGIVYDWGLLK